MEVRDYFLKKQKLCVQSLAKEQKKPAVVILQQSILYNISIRCLWLRIIRRSDQSVQLMNFSSKIFFNNINNAYSAAILKNGSLWVLVLPSYMVLVTYCYYKKNRRTMHTAIALYLFQKESQLDEVCLRHQVRCAVAIGRRTRVQLLMIRKISTYLCPQDKRESLKKLNTSPGIHKSLFTTQ